MRSKFQAGGILISSAWSLRLKRCFSDLRSACVRACVCACAPGERRGALCAQSDHVMVTVSISAFSFLHRLERAALLSVGRCPRTPGRWCSILASRRWRLCWRLQARASKIRCPGSPSCVFSSFCTHTNSTPWNSAGAGRR